MGIGQGERRIAKQSVAESAAHHLRLLKKVMSTSSKKSSDTSDETSDQTLAVTSSWPCLGGRPLAPIDRYNLATAETFISGVKVPILIRSIMRFV
jgi:hypothetical protein